MIGQPIAPKAWRWGLAAVAAIALAIVLVPRWISRRGSIGRLVAVAPRAARSVEPRLTGGFAWARYAGAHRAASEAKSAEQMRLGGVAGELVDRADRDGGAAAQHAAGVGLLLVQEPMEAVARLESAAKQQADDAKVWSDLAAARYSAAAHLGRASLYPTALAAADAALRIDPNLGESLFNRALILERLGLTEEARRAWQADLQADPSSPWAEEARSRMGQLPASTHASQFERDRPLLERAVERGDTAGVRRYVDAHRERARAWAEEECLARWADALQRNDAPAADRSLAVARAVGDALAGISGDELLRDTVRLVDDAPPEKTRAVAAAHLLYRNGREASKLGQREVAQRDLTRAADELEALGAPTALLARFYAASARLKGNDAAGARGELERLRIAANARPGYISLGGFVRWELGRALTYADDWSGAAAVLAEGAAMFGRAGEHVSEGFVDTILAFTLTALGRNDDAWAAQIRSFTALSAEGDAERLATGIANATHAEIAAGHRDAALSLAGLESAVARGGPHPQFAINSLTNRALLQAMSGNAAAALKTSDEATALAGAVSDPEQRAAWSAQIAVARGAALASSTPSAAAAMLTSAVDFYGAHRIDGALLDPLLLRARCAARTGDVPSAMRDLERGMAIVESHPSGVPGAVAGWGALDAEHAVFTDAIRLSLDRGDTAGAFALAERSHGTPLSLPDLQRRLAGSGTAVLEIVLCGDETVTFGITENDAVALRRPASAADLLASRGDDILSEPGTAAAAKLYEELIRPAGALLERARQVVIVPDQRLTTVPFAAAYDSVHGQFLVERMAVATARSAGALQLEPPRTAAPTLAAIALPSGGGDSNGLPETENEVHDAAGLYARATAVPAAEATFARFQSAAAAADVVHVAGHTQRQPGGGEQALLFANPTGTAERVSWKTILSSSPYHPGVLVLAACETLRPPPSPATRALSLGAAFSAAGAGDVIGTLAPIGDRDARILFAALHRRLASGEPAAEALRAVQREAIIQEKTNGGRRAWRAIELLTRRIPVPPQRKEPQSWLN